MNKNLHGFNGNPCIENIYHVNAAMLAVMDLVVSDNGAAVCPDLDSCQGVTVDVISFDEASAITKNVDATLIAIKNGIAPIWTKTRHFRAWTND